MDFPHSPGVYAFEHRESGKLYIGSTVDLQRRIYNHYYLMRKGKHHNEYIQRAYDKHGRDAFDTVILEVMPGASRDDLFQLEQRWLDAFMPSDPRFGYNIHPTADTGTSLRRPVGPRLLASLAKVSHPKWHNNAERIDQQRRHLQERWGKPGAKEYFSEVMTKKWATLEHRTKVLAAHERLKAVPGWIDGKRETLQANRAANEEKRKANSLSGIRKRHGMPPVEHDPVLCDWITAQYERGVSARQIGLSIGMSHATVTSRLRRRGVDVPVRGQGRTKVVAASTWAKKRGIDDLAEFDAEVCVLYGIGGSVNALSKQFKVSDEAVRNSLHRSGVTIRGKAGKPSKIPRFRSDRILLRPVGDAKDTPCCVSLALQ